VLWQHSAVFLPPNKGDLIMQWTTPQACDMRFGFEITMYIAAR
jgi:pyrroloquinoline quinone biosynthesis protein A